MITAKTVFVLGAGASFPYGFPTGKGLREEICTKSIGSPKFNSCFDESYSNPQKVKWQKKGEEFSNIFFDSDTRSIDLFLKRNPGFIHIGKIAIVHRIMEAERTSKFNEAITDDIKKKQNWYSYLFDRLTSELIEPTSFSKVSENEISFITFNYDRSLEYYLFKSLENSFYEATKEKEDHRILIDNLNKIPIYHVYGSLGKLPWQGGDFAYGNHIHFKDFLEMKDNIRVIDERTNFDNIDKMKTLIEHAERVFFLGFGFAKENMEALDIVNLLNRSQKIYCTTLGLAKKNIDDIIFIPLLGGKNFKGNVSLSGLIEFIKLEDMDC
ncbi:MAG: hypothetical protein K8R45_04905, partial [Desulfobacterales bacterium]|nr:hypothetical protein [Desulfobacterales bacterium]